MALGQTRVSCVWCTCRGLDLHRSIVSQLYSLHANNNVLASSLTFSGAEDSCRCNDHKNTRACVASAKDRERIEFWGKCCPACFKSLPRVHELCNKFCENVLEVIRIHSTDEAASPAGYFAKNHLPWLNGYDVDGWPSRYPIDRWEAEIANTLHEQFEETMQMLIEE